MTHVLTQTRAAHGCVPPRQGLWKRIIAMLALRKSRIALSELEPHLLKDIGVSEAEARKEAKRHVWDVPERWLR